MWNCGSAEPEATASNFRKSPTRWFASKTYRHSKVNAFDGESSVLKTILKIAFGGIFVWMIVMTVETSLKVSLWSSLNSFAGNPWAVATLYDAYFGFFTFWCWVAYKERTAAGRAIWFLLIMSLGNIAMSFYVLMQLFLLKPNEPAEAILRRS